MKVIIPTWENGSKKSKHLLQRSEERLWNGAEEDQKQDDEEIFFYYPTCPKCANEYGKN